MTLITWIDNFYAILKSIINSPSNSFVQNFYLNESCKSYKGPSINNVVLKVHCRSYGQLSGPKIRKAHFEASNRKILLHRPHSCHWQSLKRLAYTNKPDFSNNILLRSYLKRLKFFVIFWNNLVQGLLNYGLVHF